MVRFMSFSSGSCGNCYYLGTQDRGILIDAGVSVRRLRKALDAAGLTEDSFGAVLVTHDHQDHIRHLDKFCQYLHKPVYATDELHQALAFRRSTQDTIAGYRQVLARGRWNDIDGIRVRYFEVPHDATQTVGYAIGMDDCRFVIMTDIGRMTDEAVSFARQADTVVIESNYDMDMLMGGPYTYDLKMRIVQGHGHLSNDECADAIRRFLHPGLRNIFLCHLSEHNNTPQTAFDCSMAALRESFPQMPSSGAAPDCSGSVLPDASIPSLRCLPRRTPSPLFVL